MKEIYEWADWFMTLASAVDELGENGLIDKAKRVDWGPVSDGAPFRLINPEYGYENIDPFSFFYTLAMRNTTNFRSTVYESVKEEFGIKTSLPPLELDEAWVFPTPGAHTNTLFHLNGNGNPSLMWKLFRDACNGLDRIEGSDFNSALQVNGVKRKKLTQTLFLINHKEFVPFDDTMASIAPEIELGPFNFDKYRTVLKKILTIFPDCGFREINLFAFWRENMLANSSAKFYQISTNIYNDSEDFWREFDEYSCVRTGGPKGKVKPYKALPKVQKGDIMLVRYGSTEGRGIGIVHKNDYKEDFQDNWDNNARIHVVWINKRTANLITEAKQFPAAISRADNLKDAWRISDAYRPSFQLIGDSMNNDGNPEESDSIPSSTPLPREPSVNHPRNRILFGPPGTGKTFHAVDHALAIIDDKPLRSSDDQEYRTRFHDLQKEGQIAMVTFHQNFAYEDFIEGIRPKLNLRGTEIAYELHKGIFKQIAITAINAAKARADKRFVLIIDEINRGNIAKIFGELITLIEDSRRLGQDDATKVKLPYSGEEFGVPDNLYIIGTMNTADRSIQLLDTALRRRFTFMEMMPNAEHHKISIDIDGVNCRNLIATINKRIAALLDREHQIGHTYLFGVNSMEQLSLTFRNKIFPLLQEYFFDDWEKIGAVLGNNAFVKIREPDSLLLKHNLVDTEQKIYERLAEDDDHWLDPYEYRRVYENPTTSGTNTAESNS